MENKVTLSGIFSDKINFAMQQNYVPVIKSLEITNITEEVLEDIEINISFAPGFANKYKYSIAKIEPEETLEIPRPKIQVDTEYLFSLTEKILGSIKFSVLCGEEVICSEERDIELLAYDQWCGAYIMPEIISAFIMPNHPLISKVISNASKYLKEWTGDPSFTGYQRKNPEKVKLQMAAIYTALQAEEIVYSNPPASFEERGQRIRLPHMVLEQKMGTCLDVSVLYASCLEAVGLNPLVCFIKGHAFCGCWLEEETFADCVVDDISAITKRMAEGAMEIMLVECVSFVSGTDTDFDGAVQYGNNRLNDKERFEYVVDVTRTRTSGIHPIPTKLENINKDGEKPKTKIDNAGAVQAPKALDNALSKAVLDENNEVTKQKLWERKLLDFSLRNTLLNFRVTKNSMQILVADLSELEDRLSEGKDFRIMELPTEFTPSLRDIKMYELDNEKDLIHTIAQEEFKNSRIRTLLDEVTLENNLKSLYRNAKVSMEENGTNTLFLALGFLKWYETDFSEKPRFAPIVLIPVDIVRNRKNKGYILRSRQEEAQINITLLEYLKQDHNVVIGGLDPLPQDEHGINVPLIFHAIRQAVMGKKRWEIEEMAFVGLFSFGQFVMWNDIHNRSKELEENKIVSSLVEGNLTWQPEDTSLNEGEDVEMALQDMAIPVSADSSQMTAIMAASKGQSFVLHGPPGTGKSQTITNMIANALYQGKSVLFVAEKMAALNVVEKRLANIGLAPFCLELHSNKTNKSTVLGSLSRSLEVGKIKSPEEYTEVGEKMHDLRSKLNDVMEALHDKRDYGSSLYEAITYFEQNANQKGKVNFERFEVENLDRATIEQYKSLIREYVIATKEIGVYKEHPLNKYNGFSYSIEKRETFLSEIDDIMSKYDVTLEAKQRVAEFFGEEVNQKQELQALIELIDIAFLKAITLQDVITSPNCDGIIVQLENLVQKGLNYQQKQQEIVDKFDNSVFDYDVATAKMAWKQAESSWFLPKLINQNKLVKELNLHTKQGSLVNQDNIIEMYEKLLDLKQRKQELLETPSSLTEQMSGMFLGLQTDWKAVSDSIEKAQKLMKALESISAKKKDNILQKLPEISKSTREDLVVIRDYIALVEAVKGEYLLDLSEEEMFDIESLQALLLQFKENIDKLHSMVLFNQAEKNLLDNGLQTVNLSYKNGVITEENIESAFTCNLYFALILMTIAGDSRLDDFHGKQYDDIIEQYKETLQKYQQLTIQELVARLSAKIPAYTAESAVSSELGILKKAIKNNGRMMSLRRLFDQIPILLRKLAPCMLMSPISVAQYIDPSFAKFDLVIFDEASQLPTSEAVGTIARGKNVVVVGDPKQLPPTNFFSTNRIDEDNSEKEDLESLLDDCLAISMPEESLQWHYRSRHESLIAYSNMKYYDNKLYTFPSPSDLNSEVHLVQLDGFYDKGKSKQNVAEARAVVAEIIRRLQDKTLRNDSIGVVTFSSVQQNLIDDMLMEEFSKHPELEEFDQNSKEPIFVKNLENVQGDERDIILFSIGYGPDTTGKVSMNFGPLNREGGWRRLNVAISRARKAMIVYSVLRAEQIDLSRTRSEGVEGLKGFLEFANRGRNVTIHKEESLLKKEDSFVKEIVSAIGEMGYKAKDNVGCSEFKVDIGVIDPENPGEYLLGILIDGENSKKSATARDRFVLQPGVLGGLGWNVTRVWTLDWLDDSERVKQSIKTAIEEALARKEICETEEEGESEQKDEPSITEMVFSQTEVVEEVSHAYTNAVIDAQGSADAFYLPESNSSIQFAIGRILKAEAPISKKALIKKVLSLWGITRGGAKVESVFTNAISGVSTYQTVEDERVFYWLSKEQADGFTGYRVSDEVGIKRNMDDIPSEEIWNAMEEVLNEQMSLSASDMVREVAKKFGFSRLGNIIETTISAVINKALSDQRIMVLPNGNYTLISR